MSLNDSSFSASEQANTTPYLAIEHRVQLESGSGLTLETIAARGYWTATKPEELRQLGFSPSQSKRVPALVIPIYDKDGQCVTYQIRPDNPRLSKKNGKTIKYETPANTEARLDYGAGAENLARIHDKNTARIITEGSKKRDAIAQHGGAAIALSGVWNWRNKDGVLADIEYLPKDGQVILCFDSDCMEKYEVHAALVRFGRVLKGRGAKVRYIYLPGGPDGRKMGADDYLLTHSLPELLALAQDDLKPWHAYGMRLLTAKDGTPLNREHNYLEIFGKHPLWHDVFRYNAFASEIEIHATPPWKTEATDWQICRLEEQHIAYLLAWFQAEMRMAATKDKMLLALEAHAKEHTYHPVKDYLESLQWDGAPRLETWLKVYCHVEDNAYTRGVAVKTLLSAVARIYAPGCKADDATVFVSEQGLRKSTVCNILALKDEWFSDGLPDNISTKDASLHLHGKWYVELAELSALERSSIESMKAFISRRFDKFRPPYARLEVQKLRSNIFIGTSNNDTPLKDQTGNRRFYPIEISDMCDTDGLRQVIDQLYAEAVIRYKAGEQWYFDESMQAIAREYQEDFTEHDPWQDAIEQWMKLPEKTESLLEVEIRGEHHYALRITSILEHALHIPVERQSKGTENRAASAMKKLGWRKERAYFTNEYGQKRQSKVWVYESTKSTKSKKVDLQESFENTEESPPSPPSPPFQEKTASNISESIPESTSENTQEFVKNVKNVVMVDLSSVTSSTTVSCSESTSALGVVLMDLNGGGGLNEGAPCLHPETKQEVHLDGSALLRCLTCHKPVSTKSMTS
jgi:predicted P-loop ATPase